MVHCNDVMLSNAQVFSAYGLLSNDEFSAENRCCLHLEMLSGYYFYHLAQSVYWALLTEGRGRDLVGKLKPHLRWFGVPTEKLVP